MYSMVILDDEKIVLQGIQKLCQKEDFGFVIKGAFVDSLKALDALPGLRPHLIITDVRMPQMDGLEFARRAKEILPESEIVILSGYRDFSYAQTAMQIGVSDYLLKPIKRRILVICCTGCMNVWRQKSDRQPIIRCWMDMPEDLWEKRK